MSSPLHPSAHVTARLTIVILLVLGLLSGAQGPRTVRSEMANRPDCAAMECVDACCGEMACCAAPLTPNQSQPVQAPAPRQVGVDLATMDLRTFPILYLLPVAAHRFEIPEDAQTEHTLPRLAATCIHLI